MELLAKPAVGGIMESNAHHYLRKRFKSEVEMTWSYWKTFHTY